MPLPVRLDPRAKLYLLLSANLLLFFHADTRGELVMVALLLLPVFAAGRWRMGARLLVVYVVLLALGLWSDAVTLDGVGSSGASVLSQSADVAAAPSPAIAAATTTATTTVAPPATAAIPATAEPLSPAITALHALGMVSVGLRMMLPCIITGAYAFATTPVSEFVCAMRRMRVPEAVVVPCMVVIRFFPTIAHDYRRIRDAMALRGIAAGRFALLRHPLRSLEYVLVPLLMNATVVSRDLSVAALTKGLALPGAHTSMTTIRMRAVDWLTMAAVTVPLACIIGGVL